MKPWLGMVVVLAAVAILMIALRTIAKRASADPEWMRKGAHVGTGLITLSLPWLFDSAWPVLLLCAVSVAGMAALQLSTILRREFGRILHGVQRASGGEIYFPISVGILFVLSKGDPLLFSIPMLILTFADAVAALTGARYGQHPYDAVDVKKTAEGSIAFFTVAFLSTHIPLLLFTQVGRAETLLIGLTMGLVIMLLEAMAWRGLDNLFIPLGGFMLLQVYLGLDARALLARFCVTLVLVAGVLLRRHSTTLDTGGLMGAALVGYMSWALGGWPWLMPPVVVFITYTLLSPRNEENAMRIHNVHAVLTVASAGMFWLFLGTALHRPEYFFPFTLAFAAHLAIIGIARLGKDYPWMSPTALVVTCIGKGWGLVFLPYFLHEGMNQGAVVRVFAGLAGVTLAAVLFYRLQPQVRDCPIDRQRWWRQAGFAALGSTLGLLPIYLR